MNAAPMMMSETSSIGPGTSGICKSCRRPGPGRWPLVGREASPQHAHQARDLRQELHTRDGSGFSCPAIRVAGTGAVNGVASIEKLLICPRRFSIWTWKRTMCTRGNPSVACGQHPTFEQGFAEIGCVVANKDHQSRGQGGARCWIPMSGSAFWTGARPSLRRLAWRSSRRTTNARRRKICLARLRDSAACEN